MSDGAGTIACTDLWMVFGANARRALKRARKAGGTPAEIAARLSDQGLIPAVRGVSFDVKAGELFVIMGLSGSGKSTLVRCVSRLVEPTAGAVAVDGEDILAASRRRMIALRRRKMGMVFQHFGLFPHMTVADNVAFPLKVQGMRAPERRARAEEVIGLVGLTGREDAYPRALSGGQRQRVGIARSLAVNPEIWFLDEPFSALDPLIRRQLQDEFLRLQATLKKTIVFITHDIAEALRLADRIAIMRDGEVVQIGTPSEIVLAPADGYVAEFTRDIPRGRMMTLAAMMEGVGTEGPALAGALTGASAEGAGVEGGAARGAPDAASAAGSSPESAPQTPPPATSHPDAPTPGAPTLRADMSLDEALAACAACHPRMAVTDGAGTVVGSVTADQLARALGTVDAAEDAAGANGTDRGGAGPRDATQGGATPGSPAPGSPEPPDAARTRTPAATAPDTAASDGTPPGTPSGTTGSAAPPAEAPEAPKEAPGEAPADTPRRDPAQGAA